VTTYAYKALDLDGKKAKGRVDADSQYRAQGQLTDMHLTEVKLKEHTGVLHMELTKKKVKREEVMHFSRQLGAFVRAGVPIVDAVNVIAEEATNERFQKVLIEVSDALRGGETFTDAMASHADVFPRYYIDILRSAELTGSLDAVLDQLAGYIERDLEARRSITSALVYPGIVMVMALVTVAVLTGFVLPRFKDFFESFDAKLPLPTRIMIGLGQFVGNYWWAILLFIAVSVLGTVVILRTEGGKQKRDKAILKVAVIGSVVRFAILERFCRILAAMVKAGVPLPDAMTVATETTANRVFRSALIGARDKMINGEGLAEPLDATGLFPGVAKQMVRVGEETGTLDQQLETAAEFYGLELKYKLKKLTSLFEPAIIVFVGLVVGFVAIAMVSAMYGIFNQVNIT
jgi:type IV pilus assembly protein PilC